jgi:hypothetical protein
MIKGASICHESSSQTNMAAQRLSVRGITKFAKLQLSPSSTSPLASPLAYPSHHHAQNQAFFNLFGLITGQFNYAAPQLLPGTTVVVETTLAYPPVAVNFQVFVEHPLPESTWFKGSSGGGGSGRDSVEVVVGEEIPWRWW